MMSNSIDGNYDHDDIVDVFSDKYMSSYNSVPYHEDEMSKPKLIMVTKVNVCNTVYIITVADVTNVVTNDVTNVVTNVVTHMKTGKSDGSEGLN